MPAGSIRIRLLSFGPLKRAFAEGEGWRDLPGGSDVKGLLDRLQVEGNLTASYRGSIAVAINQTYVQPDALLHDGDEVAILPPVSGGTDSADGLPGREDLVALVREPIDLAGLQARMKAGADGAVCVFDGIVRNNTRGRTTLHLDYEAYEEMALRQMHLLRAEAIKHHEVREVAIVHRLGRLVVGETSVLIVVASAHRGAAFDACRWVIDTLKKTVPIWKKEQFVDGAVWADGEPFPTDLTKAEG